MTTVKGQDLELLALYVESGVELFFEDEPQNRLESKPIISPENIISDKATSSLNPNPNLGLELAREEANAALTFEKLCVSIKNFEGCELKKTAINTVIYDGQIDAKIMLIGEAPGANEDEQGIPFCGLSGKLLDNMMRSISLDRKKNIFITNTVFWRPPGNRRPYPEEIEICRPFVEKMIALLKPQLIILVGSTAVESLLKLKSVAMNTLRSKEFFYDNQYFENGAQIRTKVIFHPSYLLRQPTQKKTMWYDILEIKKAIKECFL